MFLISHDRGRLGEDRQTHSLQCARALLQEDDEEQQLVFVGANESRTPTPLKGHGVDEIQNGNEEEAVESEVVQHVFFIAVEKCVHNMVVEG